MCWTLVDTSSDSWTLRKIVQTEFSATNESAMDVNLGRTVSFYFSLFVPRCVINLRKSKGVSVCKLYPPLKSEYAIWLTRSTKASFLLRTLSRGVSQFASPEKIFFCISTYRIYGAVGNVVHDVQLMRLVRVRSLRNLKLMAWVMYVRKLRA